MNMQIQPGQIIVLCRPCFFPDLLWGYTWFSQIVYRLNLLLHISTDILINVALFKAVCMGLLQPAQQLHYHLKHFMKCMV